MAACVPAVVLGASGYVGGELLRLILQHPQLDLAAAISGSRAGEPLVNAFPNLHGAAAAIRFQPPEALADLLGARLAVFSAAPHGASAALIARVLREADAHGGQLTVVDVSADFRFGDAALYREVYGTEHGAPELLDRFVRALPEHQAEVHSQHAAHPGCFATAMLLAAVPLLRSGTAGPALYAAGVTGSTGSGRAPIATTHHPRRHANLYGYKPLSHRHAPEVTAITETVAGARPELHFVPHSGPFARGIHMTVQAPLQPGHHADDVRAAFHDAYDTCRFVTVMEGMPAMKSVVGTNHAQIGIAADRDSVAITVVIDNLLKGAAGGAMQWMNRLLDMDEGLGLDGSGVGWL